MTQYDRLTALDASFLHMERLETPMHVGAMSILEGEPFFDADGHFRIGDVRDLVLSRMPLMPRFRRRLMSVPYDQGRPIWVDDDRFDIGYHVRLTALPKPGTWEQLITLASRVEERMLDRERPLWELWFVEGRQAVVLRHRQIVGAAARYGLRPDEPYCDDGVDDFARARAPARRTARRPDRQLRQRLADVARR